MKLNNSKDKRYFGLTLTTIIVAVLGTFLYTVSAKNSSRVHSDIQLDDGPSLNIPVNQAKEGSKSIKHIAPSDDQVVLLEGEVRLDSAERVIKGLKAASQSGQPIYLVIDSPGGSVLDGAKVVSAMESSSVPIYTVCNGLCASMAFIIHQYGTKRLATDRAILMAHPASGGASGTLEQMTSQISMFTGYVNKMSAYVAKRAGLTFEQFHAKYISEMWLDSEDAKKNGFVDSLVSIEIESQASATALKESVKALTTPAQDACNKGKAYLVWE